MHTITKCIEIKKGELEIQYLRRVVRELSTELQAAIAALIAEAQAADAAQANATSALALKDAKIAALEAQLVDSPSFDQTLTDATSALSASTAALVTATTPTA